MTRTAQYVWCVASLLVGTPAFADAVTNGMKGINIPNIGLDGSGIDIGQVEKARSGDPDFDTMNPSIYHDLVNPFKVFFRTPGSPTMFDAHANVTTEVIPVINPSGHSVQVAGMTWTPKTGRSDKVTNPHCGGGFTRRSEGWHGSDGV